MNVLPDLVAFASDALAAQGGLVEPGDDGSALAIVPRDVGAPLGLPDEVLLADRPGPGAVACVIGSAVVDGLVAALSASPAVCAVRSTDEPPRAAQAAALAGRFGLRNAVVDVGGGRATRRSYAIVAVRYRADADDRTEGIATTALALVDGAAAPHLAGVDVAARVAAWSIGSAAQSLSPERAEDARRRLTLEIRARLVPFVEAVQRRHARDHARVAAYFASLVEETRAARRGRDPAVVRQKVESFLAERDQKLRDLVPRFTARASVAPAYLVLVDAPVVEVEARLRRRKTERTIALRLCTGAPALDVVACEGCRQPALRPAACDEAAHLLCETCVPHAQGRFACPVCTNKLLR